MAQSLLAESKARALELGRRPGLSPPSSGERTLAQFRSRASDAHHVRFVRLRSVDLPYLPSPRRGVWGEDP